MPRARQGTRARRVNEAPPKGDRLAGAPASRTPARSSACPATSALGASVAPRRRRARHLVCPPRGSAALVRPSFTVFLILVGVVLGLAVSRGAAAQLAPAPALQAPFTADDALSEARSAQLRFERLRRQLSPRKRFPWSGSDCDEVVGRICLRLDDGGDWWPVPDVPALREARGDLLQTLELAGGLTPTDPWIVGQRVAYLGEAGRWPEAEALARSCAEDLVEWCTSLLGLTLHAQGRFTQSEAAFREALENMDGDQRRRWMDPGILLDGAGARFLSGADREGAEAYEAALRRVWTFSDPLYLVEGNDRLTEHWSRMTMARTRQGATNPYGMSWGRDLEEVLVRYGWEIGWERALSPPGDPLGMDAAIGHHHPESRRYLPPGEALRSPEATAPSAWRMSEPGARDGYAPSYAPVILPADGELLRFPRGDRVVVIAPYALPDDTSHHASHDHPPFAPTEEMVGLPTQAGLFLLPVQGDAFLEARRAGERGTLMLEAPSGAYLASLEVWSPERGLAGRQRQGLVALRPPPGVPSLSDLALLDGLPPDFATLADAAPRFRLPDPFTPEEPIVIGWEVFDERQGATVLTYRLRLEREGPGLVRRVGELLRLLRPEEPHALEWEEDAGGPPGPRFRSLSLDLPDLNEGTYRLRLEVSAPGGVPVVSERTITVRRSP